MFEQAIHVAPNKLIPHQLSLLPITIV
jgi:hypothetical protein